MKGFVTQTKMLSFVSNISYIKDKEVSWEILIVYDCSHKETIIDMFKIIPQMISLETIMAHFKNWQFSLTI